MLGVVSVVNQTEVFGSKERALIFTLTASLTSISGIISNVMNLITDY